MAFAVVPFTVSNLATVGQTFNVERAGFGTPQAAIVLLSGSTDDTGSVVANGRFVVGMTDGVFTSSHGINDTDGQGTSIALRWRQDGPVISFRGVNSGISGKLANAGWSTDGITLQYDEVFGSNVHGVVLLISGMDNVTAAETVFAVGSNPVVLGYKPDVLITVATGAGTAEAGTANSIMSLGVATRGAADAVKQANESMSVIDNIASAAPWGSSNQSLISNKGVAVGGSSGKSSITSFNVDGYTLNATLGTQRLFTLSMKLPAGSSADSGVFQPSALGADSISPAYAGASEAVLWFGGQQSAQTESATGGNQGSQFLGFADDTLAQSSMARSDFDNGGTTQAKTTFVDGSIVDSIFPASAIISNRFTVTDLSTQIDFNVDTLSAGRFTYWLAIQEPPAASDTVNGDQSLPAFGQDATLEIHWTIDADQSLPAFEQAAELLEKSPGVNGDQSLPSFSQEATIADTSATPTVAGNQDLPAFVQDAVLQLPDSELNADQDLPVFGQNGLIVDNVRSAAGTVQAWEYY